MKYYVVKNGLVPGIYNSWPECEKQVKGYNNAVFKSFKSLEEAEVYYSNGKKRVKEIDVEELKDNEVIAYVDGSYDNNVKKYGYGAIIISKNSKEVLEGNGEEEDLIELRNVAGELKAAIHSIKYAIKNKFKKIYIHYDYSGIENWYKGEWRANTEFTKKYIDFAATVRKEIDVEFIKIKAHSGNRYNDEVDIIAKNAIKKTYKLKNIKEFKNYYNSNISKNGIIPIYNIDIGRKNIVANYILEEFKKDWKKSKRKLGEIKELTIIIDIEEGLAKFCVETEIDKEVRSFKI